MGNCLTSTVDEPEPTREGASAPITEKEVKAAQDAWAAGVVRVGKVYTDGGDFKAAGRVEWA